MTSPEYLALTDRPIRETIEAVLANPELLWERPYRQHMSDEGRILMLALAINGPAAGQGALKSSFARVARALGKVIHPADIEASFRSIFRALDGSAIGLFHGVVIFANPGLRDFLQTVFINDRLIPLLLLHIETAAELSELWSIFLSGKPNAADKARLAERWTASLDRVDQGGFPDRYDYLTFAVDFAGELDHEPLLDRVERGIVAIEEQPVSNEEVSEICALLEKSQFASLPSDLAARFQATVTNAAAGLMSDYSDALSFEDIQSLDESLHTYAADEQIAQTASHEAMSALARNIDAEVSNIETIEELDEFEDNMLKFMRKRKFPTAGVTWDINYRRERLADEGRMERRDTYNSGIPFGDKSMSDSQIRSMFRGLGRD